MRNALRLLMGCVLVMGLAVGCQPLAEVDPPMTPTSAVLPTHTPTIASATLTPTAPEVSTLVIWLPDVLYPLGDSPLTALLNAEINEFSTQTGIAVEVRRKRPDEAGGILATLRVGAVVAPGALPDVTLLRRADLLRAVDEGLIYPVEGRISSAIVADLFPSALRLGRANDQLFGLPYLLNFYLTAYTPEEDSTIERWTFTNVLRSQTRLTFPAASAVGLTDVVWLQYIAAVGFAPESGEPLELAPSAALVLLSFYEDMLQANLVARTVLDYDHPSDYIELVANGRIPTAVITTDQLGALRSARSTLAFAPVPTSTGAPLTLVDGWVWVIVTPTPEQQVLGGRFISWMMDSTRQSTYANQIAMPPSQRASLRRWSYEGLSYEFLAELLDESPPVMPEVATSSAARALQAALLTVLSGDASAAEAAAAALRP